MKILIDQKIKKGTTFDLEYLRGLKECPMLGVESKVVYIYSLVNEEINYPIKKGKTLYIGESSKNTKPTGCRFVDHFSCQANKGATGGENYCLSRYYWQDIELKLKIFLLDNGENQKDIETKLLQEHTKIFGTVPICQGTVSEAYHTTTLHNLELIYDIGMF